MVKELAQELNSSNLKVELAELWLAYYQPIFLITKL